MMLTEEWLFWRTTVAEVNNWLPYSASLLPGQPVATKSGWWLAARHAGYYTRRRESGQNQGGEGAELERRLDRGSFPKEGGLACHLLPRSPNMQKRMCTHTHAHTRAHAHTHRLRARERKNGIIPEKLAGYQPGFL